MLHHPQLIYSMARARFGLENSLRHRKINMDYLGRIKFHRDQYRRMNDPQQIPNILRELKSRIDKIPKPEKTARNLSPFMLVNPRKNKLIHTGEEIDLACQAIGLAAYVMESAAWQSGERIVLHDNQLEAVFALADGRIVQMDTGEGKTYVGAVRAFLNSLWGMRTMIVAPNSYLAHRDSQWMLPFYRLMGMSVTCADRSANWNVYYANVCYVSLSKMVWDYIHNIQVQDATDWTFVSLDAVIIDEVDAVLLDSVSHGLPVYLDTDSATYTRAWDTARSMKKDVHYKMEFGMAFLSAGYQFLKEQWQVHEPENEDGLILFAWHVLCALQAKEIYKKDADYIVEGNHIRRINEKTGRPDSSGFVLGVQQALEKKEGLPISKETIFIYTIHPGTILNQARNLCGMSGSAISEQIAFRNLFGLPTMTIPSNEASKRIVHPDECYINKKIQFKRVCSLALQHANEGRPVLVATQSIEQAEVLGKMLASPERIVNVITAKNHFEEARIMEVAGQPGVITVAARMAGRGVDIKIHPAVQQKGGLVVIGVGRFTLLRLDEQLIGRTGRQGHGGEVYFILSLEDEIFRLRLEAGMGMPKKLYENMINESGEEWEDDLYAVKIQKTSYQTIIKQTQAAFRDLNYRSLSGQLVRDNILDPVRSNYENLRYTILSTDDIDKVVKKLLAQALAMGNEEFIQKLERLADIRIYNPGGDLKDGKVSDKAVELLHADYLRRRSRLGEIGLVRERIILLRSLDFQWALLYLDWQKFTELNPPSFSGFMNESVFLFNRMKLFNHYFAEHALEYLFQIDLGDVLQLCYYWRGTLIPVSATGGKRLGGDVDIPAEFMFQSGEEARSRLRSSGTGPSDASKGGYVDWLTSPLTISPSQAGRRQVLRMKRLTEGNVFLQRLRNLPFILLQFAAVLIGFFVTYFVLGNLFGNVQALAGLTPELILRSITQPAFKQYIPLVVLVGGLILAPSRKQRRVTLPAYYLLMGLMFLLAVFIALLTGKFANINAHLPLIVFGFLFLLADALLWYGGININLGLPVVICLLYLAGSSTFDGFPFTSPADRVLWSIPLFAVAAFLLKDKMQLTIIKDWTPVSTEDEYVRHSYAINWLDNAFPLAASFVWTLLALGVVGFLPVPESVRPYVPSGLFVLMAVAFALQNSKWKLSPSLYNNVATHSKGVITFNKRSISPETIVTSLRWRSLLGWLIPLMVAAFLVATGPAREPIRQLLLLTAVGMCGVTAGQCLRYLYHRFQYWVDSNDLIHMSFNELAGQSAGELIKKNLKDPLFWLTWGTLIVLVGWTVFTMLR